MENTSHNCESHYQIALERRAAGLSVSDVPDLEAHLASCTACRDYSDAMRKMTAMIQTGNAAVEVGGSWRRAKAFIDRKERERAKMLKRQVPFGLGVGALMIGAGFLKEVPSVSIFGAGWMLQSLINIGYQRFRARKLNALAGSSDDILRMASREVARRYFLAWSGLVLAACSAAFYSFCAFDSPPEWLPELVQGAGPWFYGGLSLCFWVVVHMVWTESLPRLRRERKKLE